MEWKDKIKALALANFEEAKAIRAHLHQYPELSFQEFETSKFIQQKLKEYNIPFRANIAGTGIVACITGDKPSKKVVALRGDMDALPITEANDVDYKSKNEGVMHACGHDVHSTNTLMAAKILNDLKTEIEGTFYFIFQPGEEVLPGGASLMLKEDLFEGHKPDFILAQHVHPGMQVGMVGTRAGMFMASTDELHIEIIGKGGHAAMPNDYNNPILAASAAIVALDTFFMKQAHHINNVEIPVVIAIGDMHGNGATNVIPNTCSLKGNLRTMNETFRSQAHEKINELINDAIKPYNCQANINILKGYPTLDNDPKITESVFANAKVFMGEENTVELPKRMTAEDFAYFSQAYPVCFYRLGISNGDKFKCGVHTPTFDVDQDVLLHGMGLMSYLAVTV